MISVYEHVAGEFVTLNIVGGRVSPEGTPSPAFLRWLSPPADRVVRRYLGPGRHHCTWRRRRNHYVLYVYGPVLHECAAIRPVPRFYHNWPEYLMVPLGHEALDWFLTFGSQIAGNIGNPETDGVRFFKDNEPCGTMSSSPMLSHCSPELVKSWKRRAQSMPTTTTAARISKLRPSCSGWIPLLSGRSISSNISPLS